MICVTSIRSASSNDDTRRNTDERILSATLALTRRSEFYASNLHTSCPTYISWRECPFCIPLQYLPTMYADHQPSLSTKSFPSSRTIPARTFSATQDLISFCILHHSNHSSVVFNSPAYDTPMVHRPLLGRNATSFGDSQPLSPTKRPKRRRLSLTCAAHTTLVLSIFWIFPSPIFSSNAFSASTDLSGLSFGTSSSLTPATPPAQFQRPAMYSGYCQLAVCGVRWW